MVKLYSDPDPRVVKDLSCERFVKFVITDEMPDLDDPARTEIIALATQRKEIPIVEPKEGRSFTILTTTDSFWQEKFHLFGIKGKGPAGIERASVGEQFFLTHPRPNELYSDRQEHISLSERCEVLSVTSSKKAVFALGALGAANEFLCHQRMSDIGVGLRPIAAGKFLKKDGTPELDFEGRQTGAVFLEHNPEFKSVHLYSAFQLIHTDKAWHHVEPCAGHLQGENIGPHKLIDNHLAFVAKMAAAKARSCFYADVFRHSSHAGNFLFSSAKDLAITTDTDTCISVADLSPEKRGAQLIRDVSTTLTRVVDELSLQAFSVHYLTNLEQMRYQPFHDFLGSFFKGIIPEKSIEKCADSLHARYLRFLKNNSSHLEEIGTAHKSAYLDCDYAKFDTTRTLWAIKHKEFFADCIYLLYYLCRENNLERFGMKFSADERGFEKRLREGVAKHLSIIDSYLKPDK